MQKDKLTIYDIAREAGVSAATVSRVLSHHPNVSRKTYEKVRQIVEKHHFKPNSMARSLNRRQSLTLGVVLPNVTNPYYAALYTAVADEALLQGYATMMYRTTPTEPISMDFISQLIERRLDGVLMLGGIVESINPQDDLGQTLTLLMRHMPLVTIGPPIANLQCINFHSDLAASIRKAIQHLYGLGHRRIAFLGGSGESRSASERERFFIDELQRLALPTTYYYDAGHTPEAGELGTLRMLSSYERAQWPTAIITINDLVALGVIRQAKRMGLSVPEGVAVLGCDNQFFSAYTDPPLTTVDNHPADLGRVAIQQLIRAVGEEQQGQTFSHVRESTLVVRESCGAQLGPRQLDGALPQA